MYIRGGKRIIYIEFVEHGYKLLTELQKGLAKCGVIGRFWSRDLVAKGTLRMQCCSLEKGEKGAHGLSEYISA